MAPMTRTANGSAMPNDQNDNLPFASSTPSGDPDSRGRHLSNLQGTLITRRMFVAYTATAFAALPQLVGCASHENAGSQSASNDSAEDPSAASALNVEPEEAGPPPEEAGPPRFIARIVVIGDTHVSSTFEPAVIHTQAAFQAITQFNPKPDAIVINGDITDHGLEEEYDLVAQLAEEAGLQFPDDFVPVMGNHEQRGADGHNTPETYQELRDAFLRRCELRRLYYDTEVNGLHLIVLGPDADPAAWYSFKLSDEQLSWLDDLLERDEEQGRRSFVFLHQPADNTVCYTHEGELAHASLESSDALLQVVSKHPNVILTTGHSHSPSDFQRPDPEGPLFVANSAIAYLRLDPHNDSGEGGFGMSRGLVVDVYSDRTEFISWDYVLGDEADTGRYTQLTR